MKILPSTLYAPALGNVVRAASTASAPPRATLLKRSFEASIGASNVNVQLAVDSSLRATMAFTTKRGVLKQGKRAAGCEHRAYRFVVWQWEGTRRFNFLKLFYKHTARDAALYGTMSEDEWGEITIDIDEEQLMAVTVKGCEDVLACVDQIVRKYGPPAGTGSRQQQLSGPVSPGSPGGDGSLQPQQAVGDDHEHQRGADSSSSVVEYALWFRDGFKAEGAGGPRTYKEFIQLAACDAILDNEFLPPHTEFEVVNPAFAGDVGDTGPAIMRASYGDDDDDDDDHLC